MTKVKVRKFDTLPNCYKDELAIAAWQELNDHDLAEVNGKLVFTDSLETYIKEVGGEKSNLIYDVCEFNNHAEVEQWLSNCFHDWIKLAVMGKPGPLSA